MTIKRGVSLYSYQQSQFFRTLNWKDMIREVHDSLGCDGIEIIDEATIPQYPFPSETFIAAFRNEIARYNMKAVTMDIYLDVHQFRDHVMTHAEAAERLRRDIILASKLGFENVRCLCLVPIDVIEACLPVAEKYNVRIGKEIHAPLPILSHGRTAAVDALGLKPDMAEEIMALVDRTGTKHLGLVPDFGVFQHSMPRVAIEYQKRHSSCPDAIDYAVELRGIMDPKEIAARVEAKYPGALNPRTLNSLLQTTSTARPEDMKVIAPYIVSIHGKFYEMTEIEGEPGHYEDKAIDYVNPIRYLKEAGYNGYINSEYEGQRHQQDMGLAGLPDELEQVRRHHEMLKRLIGE